MNSTAIQYTVRDFTPDDLVLMNLRTLEREFFVDVDMYRLAQGKHAYPARTLLADDWPLVCVGIVSPWPSLGALWAFFAAHAAAHRYWLWRALKAEWDALLADSPDLRRVECQTVAGDTEGERVVRHLGFQWVCDKPLYGRQWQTFREWAWLRP